MVDYFGTDTVVSELRDDGLLIIRINRPEVANALNGVTSAAMENIMNHAENDKAVRAIVVTGTGKVFCAGEDLSDFRGRQCDGHRARLRWPHCAFVLQAGHLRLQRSAAGGGWRSRFPATWW
ncbi:MAG: enoyl-CoA hydratase/isomerase family protein [Adlercreutzia sp.]